MYGWNLVPQNFGHPDKLPKKYQPENPNDFDINKSTKISGKVDGYNSGIFIQNSNADTKDSNGGDWLGGSGSALCCLWIDCLWIIYNIKIIG